MNNQRGFSSVDFMFSIVVAWGFIIVFFSLTLSFTVFEVVQYVAYSTARSYLGAHVTPQDQLTAGAQKYAALMADTRIRPLFANGFFQIVKGFTPDSQTDFHDEYEVDRAPVRDSYHTFHGVQLEVRALVLDRRLPFIGSTSEDEGSFTVKLNSFLGREVSEQECVQVFNRDRLNFIKLLESSDGGALYNQPQVDPEAYALITDNGC